MSLILPHIKKKWFSGIASGASYELLFSVQTDAQAGETINWSFTAPSANIRWEINGNTVDANSVNAVGSTYGLDGTQRTVNVYAEGVSSITATRLTMNYVVSNATFSNVTLDELDLSDSDTLGAITFTASASFNYLDLNNANQSGSGLNTLFGSLDWDLADWFLDLRNNAIQYNNLGLYLNTINANCTLTSGTSTMHLDTGNGSIWWGMDTQATYDGMDLRNTLLNSKGWNTISANTCDGIIVLTTNMGAADNVDIGSVHGSTTRSVILDGFEFFGNKITDTGTNLGLTGSTIDVWIPVVETDLTFIDAYDQKIQSFALHPLDNNLLLRDGTIIDLGANSDLDDFTVSKWIHDQTWQNVTRFQDVTVNLNLTKDGNTVAAGVDRYWDVRWRVFTQDTSIETVTLPTLPSGVVQADVELFIDIQNSSYRVVESGDADSVIGLLCPISRMLHFAVDDGATGDRQPFRLDGGGDPQIDTGNSATKAVYLGNANEDISLGSFSAIHCSQEQLPHTVFAADQRLTSSGGVSRDRFNWGETSNTKQVTFDSVETAADDWVAATDGFNDSGGNAFTNNDIWGITYDASTGDCKIFTLFRGGPNDYRYVITFTEVGTSRTFDFNNLVVSYFSDDAFTAQSFIFNKALSESQMRELFETIEGNRAISAYAAPPENTIFTISSPHTEAALSYPALATGGAGTAMWLMPSGNQYQSTTGPDDETTGADVGFLDVSGNQNVSLMYSSATWDGTELDLGDGVIDTYFDLTNVEFDTTNLIIRLDANGLSSEDVAHFLTYIDTNSTATGTNKFLYLGGSNGAIYTGMSPYDGPTAKTSLEGKNWTVSVNEAELVIDFESSLAAGDTIDLSVTLSTGTATWVLPNGAVSQNSVSGLGSTQGFDGTTQACQLIIPDRSALTKIDMYAQDLVSFDFPTGNGTDWADGLVIDLGGNVSTWTDMDLAIAECISTIGGVTPDAGITTRGEVNFRADDIDTITKTTGYRLFGKYVDFYLDGTAPTITYPTFAGSLTSGDVVFMYDLQDTLALEATTTAATALYDPVREVIGHNTSGRSRLWAATETTSGPYRLRDSDDNVNYYDFYFYDSNDYDLASGTLMNYWASGGSIEYIQFLDGATIRLEIGLNSSNPDHTCNPDGGSSFSPNANNGTGGFAWDFPNNKYKIWEYGGTPAETTLSGYASATLPFDRIRIIVANVQLYDTMIFDSYLSDSDIGDMETNIAAKYGL